MKLVEKEVAASRTIMTQTVFPNDVNNNDTLYGGRLLDWIDMLGGIVAKKHSRSAIVTVSIDSLNFLNPIRQQDIVTLEAWVNYVGTTSMEIEVRVTSENPFTAESSKNCRAFLTYVAMDEEGHPKEVPRLILLNEEEKERFEKAKERRAERLRRRDLTATEW
ncbi:acyl-CoA thioesterase [Candidatus Thorarchaeota archaeon]|nr:MAG: acyl-CoA thioesterase [Candidatus Thorarchaeota archaeon]